MIKFMIPLLIVAGVIAMFVGKDKWGKQFHPAPEQAQATPASNVNMTPRPAATIDTSGLPNKDKDRRDYQIYEENFLGWFGPDRTLHTENGWYTVGEMSNKGFVVAVSERRAQISQPNGERGWVISKEGTRSTAAPAREEKDEKPKEPEAEVLKVAAESTPKPRGMIDPFIHATPTPMPSPAPLPNGRVRGGVPLNKLGNIPGAVHTAK